MPATSTFAVGTSDTPIVTTIATPKVVIQEDPSVSNFPTTDFKVKVPKTTNGAIQRTAGTGFEIDCPGGFFPAGATVGYVSAVTASTTFQQYETGL